MRLLEFLSHFHHFHQYLCFLLIQASRIAANLALMTALMFASRCRSRSRQSEASLRSISMIFKQVCKMPPMPLINNKSVVEALRDVHFLRRRPASLKDILEYMCFAHPDVSAKLLTALQRTLDAGVRFGYVDQIDENWYASPRRDGGNLDRLEPSNMRENIHSRSEDNEAMDFEILYCQSNENGTVSSENNFNAETEKTFEDTKPKSNSDPTSPSTSRSAPSSSSSPKSRSQENEFKGRKQTARRKSSNERKLKRRIVANRNRKRKPQPRGRPQRRRRE
uniref:Uncharacterized protein n=1 Tax=Glossina austeni TaxID=7395 RepID=A0A1A9VP87_GLOAU